MSIFIKIILKIIYLRKNSKIHIDLKKSIAHRDDNFMLFMNICYDYYYGGNFL